MANDQPVPEMSETIHKAQVGQRLREAIEALETTQTAVGEALGVSQSKLGNWLRGDNYPAVWFVKRFCDRYGVTTEWIYRGIVTGMRADLADRLWLSEQAEVLEGRRQLPVPRRNAKGPKGPEPPDPLPGGGVAKSADHRGGSSPARPTLGEHVAKNVGRRIKGPDPPHPSNRGTGQKIKVGGRAR